MSLLSNSREKLIIMTLVDHNKTPTVKDLQLYNFYIYKMRSMFYNAN